MIATTSSGQLWLCQVHSSKPRSMEKPHYQGDLSQHCNTLLIKSYFLMPTVTQSAARGHWRLLCISWLYHQEFGSSVFTAALCIIVSHCETISSCKSKWSGFLVWNPFIIFGQWETDQLKPSNCQVQHETLWHSSISWGEKKDFKIWVYSINTKNNFECTKVVAKPSCSPMDSRSRCNVTK